MGMPNAVKKIKRNRFHLNDRIEQKDGIYICVMRDKDLSCFAKMKSKTKVNYTKLFITGTDFKFSNFKFEFIK